MSIEENRAVVSEFYKQMARMDSGKMFELLDDEATWTVAGNPETFWPAGTCSKAERQKMSGEFGQGFVSMVPNIISMTAEEDRVVVEATVRCETHKGIVYANEFLVLFRVRNGKILRIYEQFDQQAVLAFEQALHASQQAH